MKRKRLKLFLAVGAGYVLNFLSWVFEEFVQSPVYVDILAIKYELDSGSKAI
jgi:hypothetical protein